MPVPDPTARRPSALLLSPETPYPLQGGGALRTASVLNYLAREHNVDLIVFRHRPDQDPAADLPPGLVRRICVVDLPPHRKDFLSRAWRNADRMLRGVPPLVDRFRGFENAIAEFLKGHRYRVAVIEHFWCVEYQPLLNSASDAVVLNLHNVESVLHATSARAGGSWNPVVHGRFARRSRALEQTWLPRFSEVLAASAPDAGRVIGLAPSTAVCVFPNAIPWTDQPNRAEEDVVAFSGNLEYHPNQTAVTYFSREIWPEIAKRWPNTKWRLIGMNPGAIRAAVAGGERVEVTGSVLDAVSELAAARVVVAPILSGSGTRLKIVEAWAAGRAVVSTTLGAEGLPACHGRNILLADTARDFVNCTEALMANPEMRRSLGDAGRQEYERGLCWEAAWKKLERSKFFCPSKCL